MLKSLLVILLLAIMPPGTMSGERQGPHFILEPPPRIEFANSTGAQIECAAHASPKPKIEWLKNDGSRVEKIAGLREVDLNGTLYFPPFSGELYRQDVHDTIYQCRVSNTLGSILSRMVRVRAVVNQKYEVQIYDEYVIEGNTAVFRCQVPIYASEFIIVTSWVEGGLHNLYPNTDTGGKYMVMPNGDLYIFHVTEEDSYTSYGCRTVHKLTGEVQVSIYPGRIIMTEPKGGIQPTLQVEKRSRYKVKLGDNIVLACLAQGYPLPVFRWFREESQKLSPISSNDRFIAEESGILHIHKARFEDKGKYICRINNTIGEEEIQVTLSVTAPLTVHIHPPNVVVDMGKEASLVCTPTGFPISRTSWFRNGQPLALNKRYNLTTNPNGLNISPIIKDDEGMYQCFAYNEWDMAQAVAELQLGDAVPELTYSFSEQTTQPGPPISLKCVANGNPPPQFTWSLDGFPIPDSSRFLVGQYVTVDDDVVSHVNISSIKEEDGGEYTCTAKNSVEKISHSARINVYGSPFIRLMPKITAVAGNDLVIKCPVAGYPIESITWERDGSILPINRRQRVYNNGTLIIEQAQRGTDAGTYTCQAQNRQKHTSRRDVQVEILLPPKILPIQALTNVLREGMRAAISCQVLEGDLPLSFQWQRNDKDDLGFGVAVRRLDEYSSSLVIDKVESSHSANYTCIAQNIAGSESFTVPLTVNVPPRWTMEPSDTNVVLGFDVMLHCQAEGYPEPTILWRKAVGDHPGEYKDFLYEPNVNFYRNGSLEFSHISKESEGHYLCEAKNGISNGVSKVIFLNVNSPAYFQQKSKQVYVEKGGQAHLQCTALGDNPITIVWKLGAQRIGEDVDSRYSVREQLLDEGMVSELGISHVFRHDTGVLNCLASNAYGHDEMSIHLIVQETPEVPKNIRVIDQQSRTLQLSWTQPYVGNSPITSYLIHYKLISEPWDVQPSKVVVPATQTVATIANLHPATSYHFRILAENKLGFSDPSEIIQVTTQEEEPSGVPREIHIEARSSTEIYVSWQAPSEETWNGNLLGYYVGYTESPAETSVTVASQHSNIKTVEVGSQYGGQTIIDNLSTFTTYIISVQAFNSRGAGPNSQFFTTTTKEGAPSMSPKNIGCSTASATSLDVWWEPPPVDSRNGYLQGYKINHYPAEDWYESTDVEVKSTTSLRTTLIGLFKYSNYSITVLAFTSSGDGVLSTPIFCRTAEDVPSSPADIKAAMSDYNKILVSWLPPLQSNGELSGYTIYMGIVESGKEGGTHKHVLSPSEEEFETDQIVDGGTYQFWVTASTNIGEGASTRVVTVTPGNKIPAKIMSFSQHIVTPWKQNLTLPCQTVGIPPPKISWDFEGIQIEAKSNRFEVRKDGVLNIRDIQHPDRGNYNCNAENLHGNDKIVYKVIVRVPPDPPLLHVIKADINSLHLKWTNQGNNDVPILGYVINYKRDHGDWEELQLKARETSHILTNLWCGTLYKLYITAYNKIGTGLPCDIINAYTKGTAPVKPNSSQLLQSINSTAITVWLDAWGDGGCSILYYVIEYRQESRSDWILSSNHIPPTERTYTISDLRAGTQYFLKIMVHNNAGSNEGVYNATTLAADGSPVFPKIISIPEHNIPTGYSGRKAMLPIALIFLILTCILISCVYFRKRKEETNQLVLGESSSVAQMQNQHNRDQQYAVQGVQLPTMTLDSSSYKPDSSDYMEDVCPYATFQLTKPPYTESTFSGNVYSGPYHSVRGSFVYHDLPSGTEIYKGRHLKEPEYTKVRRKGVRMRDSHLESQESDNLGSTDSEVKKILTLHLPISEYDTHASDSEEGLRGPSNQDLVTFRHCISRDIINGTEESSSSSETSPTGLRKQCHHSRKSKSKMQNSMKKLVKSGTIYGSNNEETSFTFSERIKPPTRFSDGCHGECETPSSRRGLRSVPYRLSRESTFQIDV